MTDRDTFAAAALTGLIANGDYSVESTPLLAYRMADAMLRERGDFRDSRNAKTNHGAAPAATARTDAGSARTDKAAPRPGEGTGNTQEPVAWAIDDENGLHPTLHPTATLARHMAQAYRTDGIEGKIVPLYRRPQPTLTDEERASVGVAVQCVEAAMAQKHPEEDDARELLHRTSCALRKLLERMK